MPSLPPSKSAITRSLPANPSPSPPIQNVVPAPALSPPLPVLPEDTACTLHTRLPHLAPLGNGTSAAIDTGIFLTANRLAYSAVAQHIIIKKQFCARMKMMILPAVPTPSPSDYKILKRNPAPKPTVTRQTLQLISRTRPCASSPLPR